MNLSRQKQIVLIASIGLTALLLGTLAGSALVSRTLLQQMQDPEFLNQRLKELATEDAAPQKADAPPLVRVASAESKLAQPERPIIGRLIEVRRVTASSEVSGRIIDLPLEEGTPVTQDETVLARIDDIWSKLALERYRAQTASIQAQLDFEKSELQRIEMLRERSAATDSEVEQKRATVADLQAQLVEISAAMEEESERQLRAVIVAPFDGTVVRKHAELGEHVTAGSPIVDIVSRGQIDAQLMVPESIVNFIQIGQALPIEIDPLGKSFTGKVVSVTPYGASASRTFPIRVRLDDANGRLKVGMSVTAIIATGPQESALVVSKDAVLVRPDGATVWTIVTGQDAQLPSVQPVPVAIRVRMKDEYAVEPETAGGRKLLVDGAFVVIEGAERLMPAQQVSIVTLDGE